MTLYRQVVEVREFNEQLLTEKRTEPGWFNNPHILLVGLNPKLTKNGESDYDLISRFIPEKIKDNPVLTEKYHEKSYRNIVVNWAKKVDLPLNYLLDLSSPWVSYTNLVKIPTTDEGQLTEEVVNEWAEITKNQINIFNPNLVIIFSKRAAIALLGNDAQVGQFYERDGIRYYVVYHYAYFSRRGGNEIAYKYFMQEREKINTYLMKNAVIKVTDNYVYYLDIDGRKQKYDNPVRIGNLYYVPDKNGPYKSVFGHNLAIGDPKLNPNKFESYDANLSKTTWFLLQNEIRYTKYYHIIAFDIETNFCNTPDNPTGEVLIISLRDSENDSRVSFVLRHHEGQVIKGRGQVFVFDLEEDLLRSFLMYLHKGFDVVTGWFSNGFDIPYVFNRAVKLRIKPSEYISGFSVKQQDDKTWRLFCDEGYIFDSLEEDKSATSGGAPGYSLNARAKTLFNEQKLDVAPSQIPSLWKENPDHLLDYCITDVDLLSKIIVADDIFSRIRVMQNLCPINSDLAHHNSRVIEMLLRYRNKHLKFPSKGAKHTGERTSGIIVLDPTPGLRKNVVVMDFSGMYSTIITTFNISPDRLTTNTVNVTSVNGRNFDVTTPGVIPALELEIIALRKKYEQERDKYPLNHPKYKEYSLHRDYIKTLGNSMYGVMSYKKFFIYSPDAAQAIVDIEQLLINFIKNFAESLGLVVIYGDTDSIFVEMPNDLTVDQLITAAEDFKNKINHALREFAETITTKEQLEKVYNISVGIDKIYSKFYMTNKKKRYFGWKVFSKGRKMEKPSLDVMGFETRRKDTPDFFKPIYYGLYALVLNNNLDAISRFADNVKRVLYQKNIQDLISRLKLGKNVGDVDGEDDDERMGDYKVKSTSWKAVMNGGVKIYRGDTLNLVYSTQGPLHYAGQPIEVDYDLYYQKFFVEKVKLVSDDLYQQIKPAAKPRKKRKKKNEEELL